MITKKCTRCHIEKPETEFDLRPDRPGKRRSHCKDCRRKEVRDQDKKNRKRKSLYNKDYRKTNKEKIDLKGKIYREQNRDRILKYLKSWRKSNPEKVLTGSRERKKRQKQATPSWLSKDQESQFADMYKLRDECSMLTGDPYEVDHIVPLKGSNISGLHVPWNLQVLPKDLNRSKGNRYEPETYSARP